MNSTIIIFYWNWKHFSSYLHVASNKINVHVNNPTRSHKQYTTIKPAA